MTLDLEPIKARSEALQAARVPGPWHHQPYGQQNQNGDYTGGDVFDADGEYLVNEVQDEVGAFIAHAREDIPALIAEVERLRAGRAS